MSKNISFCKNCLNISTRPRISFDGRGFCNACVWAEQKSRINWKKRQKSFLKLIEKESSKKSANKVYNCIVPVSGGKDGSYIAYTLKKRFGLNPLCVNITPPLPLSIGEKNLKNFIKSGYTTLQLNINPYIIKFLDKRGFIEMGFPYYGWLILIQTAIIRIALSMGISMIVYGEDGEVEYGGSDKTKNTGFFPINYQKKIWLEGGYDKVIEKLPKELKHEFNFWKFPSDAELNNKNIIITTWSFFENWDPYRNYIAAKKYCKLAENTSSNLGTFTNFAQNDQSLYSLHMYLCYLKYGFGRALQDVGIEIRRGAMSREQGLNLVRIYDGHFPKKNIKKYLDYYDMSLSEFNKVLDKWANKDLFKKVKNKWIPTFKIF